MGNQKFKLSDMIPNAWFYKLKEMNNTARPSKSQSKHLKRDHFPPPPPPPPPLPSPSSSIKTTINPPQDSNPEPLNQPRKSYHITRELINPPQELDFSPPRKSKSSTKSRKSSRRTSSYSSSSCKSTATFQSFRSKSNSPSSPPLFEDTVLKTEHKTEDFDIVIDVDKDSIFGEINTFDFKLPPIITKKEENPIKISKDEKVIAPNMKEQRLSPSLKKLQEKGVRLKMNSPRIMGRKQQGQNGNIGGRKSTSSKKRRSISESFAVVKSSFDPQKDFKESMVEMIEQNNLRASKDLEDLLACYLSLNSDEYHDVIIKVFKQLWFDFRQQK